MCEAHPILQTVFTNGLSTKNLFPQIVLEHTEPFVFIEQLPPGSGISHVFNRQKGSPLAQNQLLYRVSLYQGAGTIYAILEISHTALDAKTMRNIWPQIGQHYSRPGSIGKGRPFSGYVAWL